MPGQAGYRSTPLADGLTQGGHALAPIIVPVRHQPTNSVRLAHVGMHPTVPRFVRLVKNKKKEGEMFELTDGAMMIVIAITTAIGAYIFYGTSIVQLSTF